MFFLGVDGGGTKTAFALVSQDGNVLSQIVTGPSHPDQIGLDGVRKTLTNGLIAVCETAHIKLTDITHSVWGLPGFGEDLADSRALETIVDSILKDTQHECVNDVEVGWAGSLACKPGLHLVAGTGAIGFGKDPLGKTARSSGWSEVFGDEGSAYWIGRKLLQLFSKQADHRLTRSNLYYLVKEHFSLDRDLDLIGIVGENERDSVAKIAKIAYAAALSGDTNAIQLYEQAALEHSLTVQALLKQLSFSDNTPVPVSYSGGVFNSGELILNPLQSYLASFNISLQKPRLAPVLGACLYSLEKSDVRWDETTIRTMETSMNELVEENL